MNRDVESDYDAKESTNRGAPTKANRRSATNNNSNDVTNQNSENNTSYSKAVKKGSGKKTNVARTNDKRKVYILGDSMIKGIQHWQMQSRDTQVAVRSLSRSKVRQMKHYVKPAEEENPNLYILNVGTSRSHRDAQLGNGVHFILKHAS